MKQIESVVDILNQGGIIIFPTDTVFGIGCRMDLNESIDRLFKIRRRSREKAVPLLVSSSDMALSYFDSASDIVRRLMREYWPGALTIVGPAKKNIIYSPLRGGKNKVGLRMPDFDLLLNIISATGVPLLGTSANFSGKKTPTSFSELDPELVKLVDYVVPGECSGNNASTVVDCTVSPLKVLRQGSVIIKN